MVRLQINTFILKNIVLWKISCDMAYQKTCKLVISKEICLLHVTQPSHFSILPFVKKITKILFNATKVELRKIDKAPNTLQNEEYLIKENMLFLNSLLPNYNCLLLKINNWNCFALLQWENTSRGRRRQGVAVPLILWKTMIFCLRTMTVNNEWAKEYFAPNVKEPMLFCLRTTGINNGCPLTEWLCSHNIFTKYLPLNWLFVLLLFL